MAYINTVGGSNPLVYWRLDEAQGSPITVDLIQGAALDYILLSGGVVTQFQPGLINDPNTSAHVLESYLRGFFPFNYSNPWSIEAWLKSDISISGDSTLFTNYVNNTDWSYRLSAINNNGLITLELNTTLGVVTIPGSGVNFNTGDTYYIAATYSGNTVFLYINGVQRGVANNITVIDASSDVFSIGNEYNGGIETQYNGLIDEVAFYDYPLTLSTVQGHYTTGINPPVISRQGGVFASLIDVKSFET